MSTWPTTLLALPQNTARSSELILRRLSVLKLSQHALITVCMNGHRSVASSIVASLIHQVARRNSFTAAISHYDLAQRTVIIDAMREVKPPFSPEEVCREFSTLFKSYGIRTIAGDRYAGTWPVEAFSKFGIVYEQSADPKSTLYLNLLPLINSGRIRLLHQQKSINQLLGLERRTARGGRDSIDHASNGHDDLANCIAGAAVVIDDKRTYYMAGLEVYQPGFVDLDRRTDVPNASPEQIAAREREEASNQRAVFQTMGYIRNLASSGFQFK